MAGKKQKAAAAILGMLILVTAGAAWAWIQDTEGRSSLSLYDKWKKCYVVTEEETARVVNPGQNSITVSEGIAYGMLFSVFQNDRDTFQKLLNYEKKHENQHGMMNWKITADGKTAGTGGAADAEEDMAYALCIAAEKWQDAELRRQAERKIEAVKKYLLRPDDTLLPGDAWGETAAYNPSYIAPEYYITFYEMTSDPVWTEVLDKNMDLLKQNADPETGLLPDWLYFQTENAELFGYESVRVPIRLFQFEKNRKMHPGSEQGQQAGQDRKTAYQQDTLLKIRKAYRTADDIMQKMSRFAAAQGMDHFYALYHTDGSSPEHYQNNTYLSCGYAMIQAGGAEGGAWRTMLTKRNNEDYYGDSLRLWVISLSDDLDRQTPDRSRESRRL